MRREVHEEPDISTVAEGWAIPDGDDGKRAEATKPEPMVLSVADLYRMEFPKAEMLIEGFTPKRGASLIVGAAKSGKTLLAVQKAIAVASGKPLFDFYPVLDAGAAMIVEQDDPAGAGSIKTILQHAGAENTLPIYVVPRLSFGFGPELLEWLERQARSLSLKLIVLDSYTALRGSRKPGVDFVKSEQTELAQLDELGKRVGCAIELIHHASKGSAGNDWSSQAAGSFAIAAATEAQINISRFEHLDNSSPERLIRIRGRHSADLELVLRFRKETLNFEHVLEGSAASEYPLLLQIQSAFNGSAFGPKELLMATGLSLATVNRKIGKLCHAGALQKCGYGEYRLVGLR